MTKRTVTRPSPPMVLAALAIVVAMVGTAAAGPDAFSRLSKAKVKKVADKVVTNRAPGLSVAAAKEADHAKSADAATSAATAANATKLGGVAPIPAAIPMTLLNGWQPYGAGYDQPAYWVDALGEVHLKGSVAQPVAGSDVIFTLPPGLRPARSTNWPATLDSATFGTIEIEVNGDVRSRTFSAGQQTASRAFTSMEGVSFRPSDP